MKKYLFVSLLFAAVITKAADNYYHYDVDLVHVKNDEVSISLTVPKINKDTLNFYFPKIIPGTYAIYDFGKYIADLKAYGKDGKSISYTHPNFDTWHFTDAKKIYKITYKVNDTFDTTGVKNFVFEPAGTNIEAGKDFVLNNHGFFGFFQGLKKDTFKIKVTHPEGFYGATGLSNIESMGNTDIYTVKNYMRLVDSPIMYCKPDTSILKVGNANVLVAVYDQSGKIKSSTIANSIKTILNAQKEYMGGHLPIKKYAFILYFFHGMSGSGAFGALEHSNSSFYSLPEMGKDRLTAMMKEVCAHEFFHIITPLTFHSDAIGDFNYIHPRMSEHLWMYEGCTEYFAGHVQVYEGLITPKQYLKIVHSKMLGASAYNDTLPFTKMSKYVLHKYKSQYNNVYQKGALIGMCLDIKLRSLSGGTFGLRNLMLNLAHKFGRDSSFKDSDLFNIIAKNSYPEIKTFLQTYVSGDKPLPFKNILGLVGIGFKKVDTIQVPSLGKVMWGRDRKTDRLKVMDNGSMDGVGKDLGYKMGDEILKIDGMNVTPMNMDSVRSVFAEKVKPGDKFTVEVMRKGKTKTLKAKVAMANKVKDDYVYLEKDATPKEIALRKAWLNQK